MTFVAIVAWTDENRLAKYQDYETEREADEHVARVTDRFPSAFVIPHPGGGPMEWVIDPVTKTVSVVPLPPPKKDYILSVKELTEILIDNSSLTQRMIDDKKASR